MIQSKTKEVNFEIFNSALLLEVRREEGIFTSSAVAIGRNIILTAAHSVDNILEGKIFLDSHYNISSSNFIRIKDVIIHEEYSKENSNYLNDIALLVLEENLPSNINIYPIHKGSLLKGNLHRLGFGGRFNQNARNWTSPGYIAVPCDHRYFNTEDYHSVVGDSGGPLFIETKNGLALAGIHSTLEGKNLTYAVRVSSYLSWIERSSSSIQRYTLSEAML